MTVAELQFILAQFGLVVEGDEPKSELEEAYEWQRAYRTAPAD